MGKTCKHIDQIRHVTPSADGCEDCLKIGDPWVHLRLCLTCGHVGCCDSSKTSTPPSIITRPRIRSSDRLSREKPGNGVTRTNFLWKDEPNQAESRGRRKLLLEGQSFAAFALVDG